MWSLLGGIPGTIGGALLSRVAGGSALLVAFGIVLVVVGVRVVRPIDQETRDSGIRRRQNRPLLVVSMALFDGSDGLVRETDVGQDPVEPGGPVPGVMSSEPQRDWE
jgi:uncharacterized membrane protein YfcA